MSNQEDSIRALQGLYGRLDTLASIDEANMLIPGGHQEFYYEIIEEAYAVLVQLQESSCAKRKKTYLLQY